MFPDDDLVPISALQHLVYCERQAMLIHLEAAWAENRYTAEGRRLHDRTHREASRMEAGKLVARGLRLVSYRLGLVGAADVVEFHPAETGAALPARAGFWRPFPIEYKRGRPKKHGADEVQLCAQALCLEEMLGVEIPSASLFYGQTRRRKDVALDAALRGRVEACARRLHELIAAHVTPPAVYEKKKCERCSLMTQCMPDRPASARGYLRRMIAQSLQET